MKSSLNLLSCFIFQPAKITHLGFRKSCCNSNELAPVPRYFIICPVTQQTRAIAWLKTHLPPDGSVQVTDVTSMFSGINIIGPHAQQLLADVSDFPTNKTDFRPMTTNMIDVGHASSIRAMRLTHTGEDGFILYIPAEVS